MVTASVARALGSTSTLQSSVRTYSPPSVIHPAQKKEKKEEAEFVVDNINDIYDGETVKYKDCAVLYRNNSQSAALEQALMERGVKYCIYGSIKFYLRAEIKDVSAYLKLFVNPKDDMSCSRIIESLPNGIGKATIENLSHYARNEDLSLYEYLKAHKDELTTIFKPRQGNSFKLLVKQLTELYDLFKIEPKKAPDHLYDLLKKNGYIDDFIANEMDDQVANIKKFIDQFRQFISVDEATIEGFVQNIVLMSGQDEVDDEVDACKLMTVHTAKGLEFDNVFVFGLIEEVFPNARAMNERKDGLEEERRLFYVAITRARKRLFLSTNNGKTYRGDNKPSRFLTEIRMLAKKQNVTIKAGSNLIQNNDSFRPGSIIMHDIFGEGVVLTNNDGIIDVVFKDNRIGRKRLNSAAKFIHLINK